MIKSRNAKPLTEQQVEKIRLLLSTYQDGTGQYVFKKGPFKGDSLPNWRDFERSVAAAMDGKVTENKNLFDVVVRPRGSNTYGISCKMRSELGSADKKGLVYLEVSNAARKFWKVLEAIDIHSVADMTLRAAEAGKAIIELVEQWAETAKQKDGICLDESYYLVLLWDTTGPSFQLYQLGMDLPDPEQLSWHVRKSEKKGSKRGSGSLVGTFEGRVCIEWYSSSGGQLKHYPSVKNALWKSEQFKLEDLPNPKSEYTLEKKAQVFFPTKWKDANK